jgi:hypothetical protein
MTIATTSPVAILAIAPDQIEEIRAWESDFLPVIAAGRKGRMARLVAISQQRGQPHKTVLKKFYAFEREGIAGLVNRKKAGPRLWNSRDAIGLSDPRRRPNVASEEQLGAEAINAMLAPFVFRPRCSRDINGAQLAGFHQAPHIVARAIAEQVARLVDGEQRTKAEQREEVALQVGCVAQVVRVGCGDHAALRLRPHGSGEVAPGGMKTANPYPFLRQHPERSKMPDVCLRGIHAAVLVQTGQGKAGQGPRTAQEFAAPTLLNTRFRHRDTSTPRPTASRE